MTEKRFDYEGKYVTMGNGVFVIAQTINDAELITKTLNELYEENQQLYEENQQLKIEIMGQSEEIEILSDENKRLRCINKQLEERLGRSVALDMSKCGDVE